MATSSWRRLLGWNLHPRSAHQEWWHESRRRLLPTYVDETSESAISATIVTEIAIRLRPLVEQCVPVERNEDAVTRPHSKVITRKVVQAAREAGGAENRACVVFCLLVTRRWWKHQVVVELWDADLHQVRATACEVIAKKIIESEEDVEYLVHSVLLKRYSIVVDGRTTPPQTCVNHLWRGWLVQDENDASNFVDYKARDNTFSWIHLDPDRMRAPMYQTAAQMFISFVYLALYTVAINTVNLSGDIDVVEGFLYAFTFGFICDEVTKFWKAGYHILGFCNAFNFVLYSFLTVSLVLRLVALSHGRGEDESNAMRHHLNELSYNFLAVSALMFWVRLLLHLDSYRFFGAMLVVLKVMKENNQVAGDTVFIIQSMANAVMQSPDFDGFMKFQHPFGLILYYAFTFIVMVVLLNILIALHNSAYEDIYDNANDEYLALFAQKTMQFVRAPDENVFIPPFNLIEVFCLALPLEWWLNKKTFERINDYVMATLYSPLLLVAAVFETRSAYEIRTNKARGEDDDGSVEEWEQMKGVDFESDGWGNVVDGAKTNLEKDVMLEVVRELRAEVKALGELIGEMAGAFKGADGQSSSV